MVNKKAAPIKGSAQNRANLYAKRFRVGTTISQPTWPGVPDRLHPAHGAGAGPATFRDPRRIRRGLLKGEQLHALARCVHYGRLDQRDFERQTGAASCLLLILAAIIYWQIREIDRVLSEAGSDGRTISTSSYCPISARSGGTTSSSTARVPAQPQSRAKRKA